MQKVVEPGGQIGPSEGGGTTEDSTKGPLSSEYPDVLQLVRELNPTASGFFLIAIRKGFMGGTLVTIGFRQADGHDVMNFAFKTKRDLEIFRTETQVLDGIARRSAARGSWKDLFDPDFVPGVIALFLMATILLLVSLNPNSPHIPDVISSGLALVLGFYFGRKAS